MKKFFDKIKNKANSLAVSAKTGAGLASTWNAYQPKEPKILKK